MGYVTALTDLDYGWLLAIWDKGACVLTCEYSYAGVSVVRVLEGVVTLRVLTTAPVQAVRNLGYAA